ncbi:MAG: signal-transduction protein [Chloroflexi bacterium OLB14]|nr:MAG: signal-transduction protein [Chloroflexi bacterium OLB14]
MSTLVKDLMHQGVITCKATTTLGHVAVLLNQHNVHALFVTDRDGRIMGVISDFDLMAGEWLSSDPDSLHTMKRLNASELMSHPVDTIDANASLTEAVNKFTELQISRLMVTENEKPVGILSISDLIANIAKAEKAKRDTVGDVMSDAILVCRGKTSVTSVAQAMTSSRWRSVLVVDAKGKVLGVVSGHDLLNFSRSPVDEHVIVRDVMHPALTIDINSSLREAADMMIQNHHHRLVVIDKENPDDFPLGVISSFDIVAEMAKPDSVWQK